MSFPLFILSIGSIFVGYLFKDMFIGVGSTFFGNSIFVLSTNINLIEAEFLDPIFKFIPVIFSFIGAILSVLIYHFFSKQILTFKTSKLGMLLYSFFNNK